MASPTAAFVCLRCLRASRTTSNAANTAIRTLTTTPSNHQRTRPAPSTDSSDQLPRWLQTPPAMSMPHRLRPLPKQPPWRVNTSQSLVDETYDRFLGRIGETIKDQDLPSTRGRDLLPEEIKWLALTHKSFDHGRRGFNDRLAFLGKRIVDLQTSLALLDMPSPPAAQEMGIRVEGEMEESLRGLGNVTAFAKQTVLERSRLAQVAVGYGINKVVRWKPRKSDNLKASGEETVLAHTVYSIIGALALQRGGEVAARVVRERVLRPLGLT